MAGANLQKPHWLRELAGLLTDIGLPETAGIGNGQDQPGGVSNMIPFRRPPRRWLSRRSAWGVGLALALGALYPPGLSRGESQGAPPGASAQYYRDASHTDGRAAPPPLIVEIHQPKGAQPIATEAKDDRQWYASPDWWVAGFTGALFIATVGLWIFTGLMWAATRRAIGDSRKGIAASRLAAKAAQRSARIAEKSIESNAAALQHAREVHRSQQRAWLGFTEIELTGPVEFVTGGAKIPFQLTVKNFGATPASGIKQYLQWEAHTAFNRMDQLLDGDYRDAVPASVGLTLFPTETFIHKGNGFIEYRTMGLIGGDEGDKLFFTPTIIVIIYYNSFEDGEPRKTQFVFNLLRAGQSFIVGRNMAGIGPIPQDELSFMAVPHRWYAD